RYDYNQIMYRLALDDPRLFLPVPVYQVQAADGKTLLRLREDVESNNQWGEIEKIPFFAFGPDRRPQQLVPFYSRINRGSVTLQTDSFQNAPPIFYALPPKPLTAKPELWLSSPAVIPLYEYHGQGKVLYSTESRMEGMERSAEPIARVWRNPMSLLLLDTKSK